MLTSHSAGIQCLPFTFPWLSVSVGGAPWPLLKPAVSSRFQLVLPAIPFSLPTHRISGPISLNTIVLGANFRIVCSNRLKSYSCFLPFGPSPFAPSHQNSKKGPYRAISSFIVFTYTSLYSAVPYFG